MYSPARLATRCLSLQHLLCQHKSVAQRWNRFHLNAIGTLGMIRKPKLNVKPRPSWHLENNWRKRYYRSRRPNLHHRRCTLFLIPAIPSSCISWGWNTLSTILPRTKSRVYRSNRTAAPSAKSTSPQFGSGKNRVNEEIQLFKTVQLEKIRRSFANNALLATLRRHLRLSILIV